MKISPLLILSGVLAIAVACSSRTGPPGGAGPSSPGPQASVSRNFKAETPAASSTKDVAGPGDPGRGKAVYNQVCAVCHQNGANGAPPLFGVMRRRELPSGTPANDDRVRDTIKMGRANMPGFEGALTDQQINDVIAYLHQL